MIGQPFAKTYYLAINGEEWFGGAFSTDTFGHRVLFRQICQNKQRYAPTWEEILPALARSHFFPATNFYGA